MEVSAAKKLLKENPVFWSRLGFCYDPPLKNEFGRPLVFTEDLGRYGKYHRSFSSIGVKIHTCILHSGWVGIDEYDYSLTDRVLDEVFRDSPDCYFIPRIKLNVPIDWCEKYPEEVFVYHGGPETADEIRALVGTLKQDYIGYEAPNGYYMAGDYVDTRPNVGGLIARQSFSSKKWREDATVALEKLIERLEKSKYADRIIGYHVAYGVSGECILWGRASERYGDYGISHRKAFFDWGIKKYGSREKLADVWGQKEINRDNVKLPSPDERYAKNDTIEDFFRGNDNQTIATDFDYFISEINADTIEHFAKVVKEKTEDKLVGAFYGYFIHTDNPSYAGHLALDKLLNSPYIDFFAAPKSYYRNLAGDPGGIMLPTQSVNRKKLWLDELDNRTHLAHGVEEEWASKNLATTRTVFWREFAKNLADDSGFWWMDLGGGWFDDDDIMNEFSSLVRTNEVIRKKEHKSVGDILVLVDEDCINHMNISSDLRLGFMEDFLCELHMTGCISDVYRLRDLEELNIEQYKLIIFAYTFKIDEKTKEVIAKIPKDKTLMFNYAAGVISDNGVSLENVSELTGISVSEADASEYSFPALKIEVGADVEVLHSCNGVPCVAKRSGKNGGVNIVNAKPFADRTLLRKICEDAGCHTYAPAGNTVYGDNRFIGIFPSEDGETPITLKEKGDYENAATGEVFENTASLCLKLGVTAPIVLIRRG